MCLEHKKPPHTSRLIISIFLPKYFPIQVIDGCHTSFLTSTWQYWENSAAHFAKSSSSSSSDLPFPTRVWSPLSAILDRRSKFEPTTLCSAVNHAVTKRFETLTVFPSLLIFHLLESRTSIPLKWYVQVQRYLTLSFFCRVSLFAVYFFRRWERVRRCSSTSTSECGVHCKMAAAS